MLAATMLHGWPRNILVQPADTPTIIIFLEEEPLLTGGRRLSRKHTDDDVRVCLLDADHYLNGLYRTCLAWSLIIRTQLSAPRTSHQRFASENAHCLPLPN